MFFTAQMVQAGDAKFDAATTKILEMLKTELRIDDVQYGRIGTSIQNLIQEKERVTIALKDSPDAMKIRLEYINELIVNNILGGLKEGQQELFKEKKLADKL